MENKVRPLSRRLIPFMIVGWTLAVTIARAIRLPNDFSEAYWLIDYRFGFVKRGLIGSLYGLGASALGAQKTPNTILGLSILIFCCFCLTFLALIFRLLNRHTAKGAVQLMALVFASSSFMVMNAHLLGYFDALLYLFAVASVVLFLFGHPFLAALISSMAMLSHESYLLIGYPSVCLAFVLSVSVDNRPRLTRHAVALCMPLLVFIAIAVFQNMFVDEMTLRQELATHLDAFGFVASRSEGVAEWQTTSFFELLRQNARKFDDRIVRPVVLASVGPTLITILYFIYSSFRIRLVSLFSVILLGVIFSPLAMHAVAWDTARISTYTIGSAFIASWILVETRNSHKTDDLLALIAVPALALNIFGSMPLMDGEFERFSRLTRLILYAPALILALNIIVKRSFTSFPVDLKRDNIPSIPIDSDQA